MSDEPPHFASGLSYVATGVFRGNLQHPPLIKELSGLSLLLGGIRWPRNPATEAFLRGDYTPGSQPDWDIGNDLLAANGPDRTLFWARLPVILVACLLGAMLFVWGRALFGALAATGAVLLFATDPTMLAHSFSVTMDIGLSAFSLVFLFALWRYLQQPTRGRLVIAGVCLGLVLAAKFSAAILLPTSAALFLLTLRWPVPKHPSEPTVAAKSERPAPRAKDAPGGPSSRDAVQRLTAWAVMFAIAMALVYALYFFPRDPLIYFHGMQKVNADHNAAFLAYMAGNVAPRFPEYFAVAYLLKEPLPTVILAVIGLTVLIVRRSIPVSTKLFVLLPPAAYFLATTLWADNLGVRYIMPVLAFGHLLGGLGLAALLQSSARWTRAAAAVLCVWMVVATIGVAPDHLSYFNEAACLLRTPERIGLDGGSQCGASWLDDSNIDWNQGLKQLKTWLDRSAPGRAVRIATPYTSFPPRIYGLNYTMADFSEMTNGPVPGLYAVSASLVARVPAHPGTSRWLRVVRPVAIVGHAYYIYDIRAPRP